MAEITHLICAHCGGDNLLSNYNVSDGTLEIALIPNIVEMNIIYHLYLKILIKDNK